MAKGRAILNGTDKSFALRHAHLKRQLRLDTLKHVPDDDASNCPKQPDLPALKGSNCDRVWARKNESLELFYEVF